MLLLISLLLSDYYQTFATQRNDKLQIFTMIV